MLLFVDILANKKDASLKINRSMILIYGSNELSQ